ncbi:MAG TPA: DUF3037 domain-containing protein [Caldimonas sp.]|nr:DUF3037 domain-containing protein [Caldimonas sp.]
MPALQTYDYAIVRVVPRVERGEFVNVGVIVSCDATDLLAARIVADEERIRSIDPAADLVAIGAALGAIEAVCSGAPDTGALARMTPRERFHWLVAPRSAVIQTSPVHTGRTADCGAALDHLFDRMVGTRAAPGGRN